MLGLAASCGEESNKYLCIYCVQCFPRGHSVKLSLAAATIKEFVLWTDWCCQQISNSKSCSSADPCILMLLLISHISIKH